MVALARLGQGNRRWKFSAVALGMDVPSMADGTAKTLGFLGGRSLKSAEESPNLGKRRLYIRCLVCLQARGCLTGQDSTPH
jgi:hypothetical protein